MVSKIPLIAGIVAVAWLAAGAPASAQIWGGPRDDRDGRYDRAEYQRQAYDNGYRRGAERGERDGRDGRALDYRDEKDYRNADWGYSGRYGSREYYRQSFRSGFETGYYAGYNRYGRYSGRTIPRPPVYGNRYPDYGRYPDNRRSPAPGDARYGYGYGYAADIGYQNGLRDGLEKGRKDWRDRRSYDVVRHGWYRDGDRHYKKEYGLRDDYRDGYRMGFQRGYDEAFGRARSY
jgi:hypothetical protein